MLASWSKETFFYCIERDVPPLLVYQLIRNCGNQLFTCMPDKRTKLAKRFWSELKEKGISTLIISKLLLEPDYLS